MGDIESTPIFTCSGAPREARCASGVLPEEGLGAMPILLPKEGDKRVAGGGQKGPKRTAREDRTFVYTPPLGALVALRSLTDRMRRPFGRLRRNRSSQMGLRRP